MRITYFSTLANLEALAAMTPPPNVIEVTYGEFADIESYCTETDGFYYYTGIRIKRPGE